MKKALLIVALVAMCATGVQADVMTFSGTTEAFDNWISPYDAGKTYSMFGGSSKNYGNVSYFQVSEDYKSRATLRFDVSALAGQFVTINSITLRLFQQNASVTNMSAFRILPADSIWEEGSDTGSTSYGAWHRTTWNYANQGVWQGWSGGSGAGAWGDLLASVPATSGGGWVDMVFTGDLDALMTAWVQTPVDDVGNGGFSPDVGYPIVANEGLLLLGGGTLLKFDSSENGSGNGPQLVVDYVVPEPATMSLLAVGGILGLIRRKK